MDLKQLEYFVAVAKLSSLTRAAEALYTTQPHVSMVIHSLEEELQLSLFKRRSKGVELTEDGRRIFTYAEKALKDVDIIRRTGRNKNRVWLRIASNPSSYMASMLSAYYDCLQEEGITLQFSECGIEEMIERMSRDWYDLGFLFVPMDRLFALRMMTERRHLEYVELFRSGLVLHVGRKHPLYERTEISPKELSGLAYIQTDDDYFNVEELLKNIWKNPESHSFNHVISTNSDHLVMQMLESGKVCNLGSYWLREKYREHDFRMIPVTGYNEEISFGYIMHTQQELKPQAKAFLGFLEEQIHEDRKL